MPPMLIDCRLMLYRKAGISNYTRRLVQGLAALPNPPNLQVLLDRRDQDTQWVPPSVCIRRAITPAHHRYEGLTLPLELLVALRQMPNVKHQTSNVSKRAASVVHFPDFIACAGPFKKIITIHDLYFMTHPEVMSADGARYYGQIHTSARRADAIIAVSHYTKNDVTRLLPAAATKVQVVPEAADIDADSPQEYAHADQHSVAQDGYALFVGTFEPRKNLVTLLHALRATPPTLRLTIVGESGWTPGSEPTRLAQDLGVAERVHLAGRVSDAELDRLYRDACMLVFPSLSEGFGLPALEAMARGTPVICANTGSLPEIVGTAALLHDPLDAQQLAHHMTQLWQNDALHADYRRRGLQRAQTFSWARCAAETLKIYTTL